MREKILSYIQDSVKEQSIELQLDSILADLIDSITFVKMVVSLEEEFDLEFEDQMLIISKFEKTEDLVDYVKSRLDKKTE